HRRESTHGLNTSREDRPKDKERFRNIGESYDDSFSRSYRDGNRSHHMKRRRDNGSPLSSVSRSDSSDGRHRRSRSKRHKSTNEDDLTRPWMCEKEDLFTPRIQTGCIKGAPECMRISGFMHGVNNLKLTKCLNEHEGFHGTFPGEAAAASKKRGHASWKAQDQSKRQNSDKRSDFQGHSRERMGSNRFTPLQGRRKRFLRSKQVNSIRHHPW
nr:hypothetical protein [Tanacetum cinerariifolium]